MNVLVTGGAGYLGSHTCVELLNSGINVIVIDNLSNSSMESINMVQKITRRKMKFYKADLLNEPIIDEIFRNESIDAVIHFAAYKSVSESVQIPILYYRNNISGTLTLLEVMKKYDVKNFVFSSSATVYGIPEKVPITEDAKVHAVNPYGRTKSMIEDILKDLHQSDPEWNITILRYFNPIGAHKSGLIGENPRGVPNNLMPNITEVVVGYFEYLNVYGIDYDTSDGTCVRDYIHVVDLAVGHVKAIEKLYINGGLHIYNLGTGRGYSVLELINIFERVCKCKINYQIQPRRAGDIAECYAANTKAVEELEWKPIYGIEEMCKDSLHWQMKNSKGYVKAV